MVMFAIGTTKSGEQVAYDIISEPKNLKAIYDNGGETMDRYTFVYRGRGYRPHTMFDHVYYECLGTCEIGRAVSMHSECVMGPHLGKKIKWNDLTIGLQKHVAARMSEAD